MKYVGIILVLIGGVLVLDLAAQQTPNEAMSVKPDPEEESNQDTLKKSPQADQPEMTAAQVMKLTGHTAVEIYLSLGVLIFGGLLLALQMVLMWREAKYWDANATKIFGLTLVISAVLFLVTAGYNERQIGPVLGLLGTVVGYLLRGEDRPVAPQVSEPKI